MNRYFLKINDARDFCLDEITLLSNRLVIKKEEKGKITLEPVLSTDGYNKREVDAFNSELKANNKELYFEIYKEELNDQNIPETLITIKPEIKYSEEKKEGKLRYFLTLKEASKFFEESFNLFDERLVIKRNGKRPEIRPVITTYGYHRVEIGAFNRHLALQGEELLVEIDPKDRIKLDDSYNPIIINQENQNIYTDVTNDMRNNIINLIEYGYLNKNKLAKEEDFHLVELSCEEGKLLLSEDLKIDSDEISKILRRKNLKEKNISADLYLFTDDKEVLKDASEWITQIKPSIKDTEYNQKAYTVINQKHLLLKPLTKELIDGLDIEAFDDYQNLISSAQYVKKQRMTDEIIISNTDSNDYDDYLLIRKENLLYLLSKHRGEIPFESSLEVYHEDKKGFRKVDLRDSLDIKKELVEEPLYFIIDREYSPVDEDLSNMNTYHFEIKGFNEDGLAEWRELSNKELNIKMPNRYLSLIDITNHPNLDELYEKYNNIGYIKEFVRKYNIETGEHTYITSPKEHSLGYQLSK